MSSDYPRSLPAVSRIPRRRRNRAFPLGLSTIPMARMAHNGYDSGSPDRFPLHRRRWCLSRLPPRDHSTCPTRVMRRRPGRARLTIHFPRLPPPAKPGKPPASPGARALTALTAARRLEQSDQKPDRHNDHGAEQEISPQPADGIEAHVPDRWTSRRTDLRIFQGSRPIAARTTPTRIDSRISRPTTASGGPPKKR